MGMDPKIEGVDIPSEDSPHWSHSGFMHFLSQVAAQVGVPNLRGMKGLGGTGEWPAQKDPIFYLLRDLRHTMAPKRCAMVAPRLAELIEKLPDCVMSNNYDKVHGRRLVAIMVEAAKKNKRVVFSN